MPAIEKANAYEKMMIRRDKLVAKMTQSEYKIWVETGKLPDHLDKS